MQTIQDVMELLDKGRPRDAITLWETIGSTDPEKIIRHPFVELNLDLTLRVLSKLDPNSNLRKYMDFRARIISEEQHGYIQTFPLNAPILNYESRFDEPYYGSYEEGENSWCPGVITHLEPPNEVVYFGHLPGEFPNKPRQWNMADDVDLFQPMCQFDLQEELAAWDSQDDYVFVLFFFRNKDLDSQKLREARVIKADIKTLGEQAKKFLEEV